MIDTTVHFERAGKKPVEARRVSSMAHELIASEILKIAGQIRGLIAEGVDVLNLTVGDFRSEQFPVPRGLIDGVKAALDEGHTNYPPASGVPECRQAVQRLFARQFGLDYPIESILIAGGARPMIAGTYLATVNPGDKVVYPLPSWNNNHYNTMVGADRVEVVTSDSTRFFPRASDLLPHLPDARLLCINTPLNPTGTLMDPGEMRLLCEAIVAENKKRNESGAPSLYLMFDQVYWMLTHHGAQHATPVGLVPEMASYTIFVDGISKGFAATGLRVGWALGPPDVMERMTAILTHLGAWAPRPEQIATARFLDDEAAMKEHIGTMSGAVLKRLDTLAAGIRKLREAGHDIDAIDPTGAIYLSMRINAFGKKTPGGKVLETSEDIRRFLLDEARVGLVPFECFGIENGGGWFRASVGAVSEADCQRVVDNLGAALNKLT